MDPVTGAAVAQAVASGVTAGIESVNTILDLVPEAGFIMGGEVRNMSETDFEVTYMKAFRGTWQNAEGMHLDGAQSLYDDIMAKIKDQDRIDITSGGFQLRNFVNEHLIEAQFKSRTIAFKGRQRGSGFKGCVLLYSKSLDLSVVIYTGKAPNRAFKAGVCIVDGKVHEKYRYKNKGTLGLNGDKWEDFMLRREKKNYKWVTFSRGGSKTTSYKGLSITYNVGQNCEFYISGGQRLKYGQLIALRTHHDTYISNNGGKLHSNEHSITNRNTEVFYIYNVADMSNRGDVKYGDEVCLMTKDGNYIKAKKGGSVNAKNKEESLYAKWTLVNPRSLEDRGKIQARKVAFRSNVKTKVFVGWLEEEKFNYLVAESDGDVAADRLDPRSWESFQIVTPLGFFTNG